MLFLVYLVIWQKLMVLCLYSLLCLLASEGGGKSSGKFALEVVKLGLEREQGLINLLLVVSVDAGDGEGGDPGQGDQGQSVEDGPDISQRVHAHGELDRFHSILNKEKRLQLEEDVVQLGEEDEGEAKVSWQSDINIQELLKRVSFVSFIYGRQHRFVDPEAQCGGDEGQRQVTHNTDQGDVSHRQEAHQDRATHDARVPGVLPVQQEVDLV